jgi:uncharacterized membrane protein
MAESETWLFALTLSAAIGCSLTGGVFFAFSSFVMKSLLRLPARTAIVAMQSINAAVLRSWFLVVFLGTAVLCLVALAVSIMRWGDPLSAYLLPGSLLYLMGGFFVTIAFNVPRNEALATVSPSDPEHAKLWSDYAAGWTRWNHVRTAASLAAAVLLALAAVHP